MPRIALGIWAAWIVVAFPAFGAASGADPHLDASVLRDGCATCHVGHGQSDSPMLATSQKELCLGCHGDGSTPRELQVGRTRPVRLEVAPFGHPVDDRAYSRSDGVTCTSCHSPHRGVAPREDENGARKVSMRDGVTPEHVLCLGCHGARAGMAESGSVAARVSASGASYHPVEAPANGRAVSLKAGLAGRRIACTDCHGSDEPGRRGLHGSRFPGILVRPYNTIDGENESEEAYALCYGCHDRESILRGDSFPGHPRHVVELKLSCASCHDPHGSPDGRALTTLAEGSGIGRLAPSARSGRLAFDSPGPGAGSCHVSCHGRDHGPESYGAMTLVATQPTANGPGGGVGRTRPSRRMPPAAPPTDSRPGRVRGIDP